MNRNSLLIAALSVAAFAAHADDADPSGQFAASVANSQASRAQVQARLADYRKAGVNPWSTSYNPLKSFQGQRSRAEVQAEYLASRDTVAAMTREDSGSAYLAARRTTVDVRHLAGEPVNAQ
jgi:opacity protein-like surface antigen